MAPQSRYGKCGENLRSILRACKLDNARALILNLDGLYHWYACLYSCTVPVVQLRKSKYQPQYVQSLASTVIWCVKVGNIQNRIKHCYVNMSTKFKV